MKEVQKKYSGLTRKAKRSPLAAIRLKCLDCVCDQSKEVTVCSIKKCPLWPHRFGKRPATAKRKGKEVGVCF